MKVICVENNHVGIVSNIIKIGDVFEVTKITSVYFDSDFYKILSNKFLVYLDIDDLTSISGDLKFKRYDRKEKLERIINESNLC